MKEVQQFLDKGKSQTYAKNATLNALLAVSLRITYLRRLKWTHHITHDAMHRKVLNTLQLFIDEDDMDFDKAAESAVEKRKFLLNRVMQEKLLPTSRMMTKKQKKRSKPQCDTLNYPRDSYKRVRL